MLSAARSECELAPVGSESDDVSRLPFIEAARLLASAKSKTRCDGIADCRTGSSAIANSDSGAPSALIRWMLAWTTFRRFRSPARSDDFPTRGRLNRVDMICCRSMFT